MSLPFWSSEKAAATLDRVLPASQDALGPGAQVVAVLAVRDDTRKIRKRTLELDVLRLRAAERELERSPIE